MLVVLLIIQIITKFQKGNTQHAETIEIVFDQDIISFQNLLAVFLFRS